MIDTRGPISFREFFDFVLYEPENGYYSRPEEVRTGREGDFFTAVSVGSLFGRILARSAQRVWKELAEPECFRIVEWGAEQGDLARDISTGIAEIGGAFEQAVQYAVVEPITKKAAYLRTQLPSVEVVGSASELLPMPGLVIANELIDALSFWLIRFEEGKWLEKRVAKRELEEGEGGEEELTFVLTEPEPELARRLDILQGLGNRFSEGYETEIRPSLSDFLSEMASVLSAGEVLLIDYGYEHDDYYHPGRSTGTLRTYGKHESGEDPLQNLGQLDLTAHVDFTLLAQDGEEAGLVAQELQSQGSFLTHAAMDLLRSQEGQVDPDLIRQFQTLTHPAHLGSRFWVQRFAVKN